MASAGCVCGLSSGQRRWLQALQISRPATRALYQPHRRRAVTVRAAAEAEQEDKTGIDPAKVGIIPFLKDDESFQDVMAFTGTGPERINGRTAMIAFVAIALTEVTQHKGLVEQLQVYPGKTVTLMVLISIASLIPKYVSGVSLRDLYDAASKEGLPDNLKFFNRTHEVWLGRVAMLGLTGLAAVEILIKKGALFG